MSRPDANPAERHQQNKTTDRSTSAHRMMERRHRPDDSRLKPKQMRSQKGSGDATAGKQPSDGAPAEATTDDGKVNTVYLIILLGRCKR